MNKLFNLVLLCFVVALTASCDSATTSNEPEAASASSSQLSVPCNTTSHAGSPLGELQLRQCDFDGDYVTGGSQVTITKLISNESASRNFVAPSDPLFDNTCSLPTNDVLITYNLTAGLNDFGSPDNSCALFWAQHPQFTMRFHDTYLVERQGSSQRLLVRYSGDSSEPDARAVYHGSILSYVECHNDASCIASGGVTVQGNAVKRAVPAKYEYDIGYGTVTSSNSSYGIMTVTGGTGGFQACPLTYLTYSSFNDLGGSRPSAGQNVKLVGVIDTNDCDVKLYDWVPN